MTDLVYRIQPVVTVLKKNPSKRLSTLISINQYWEQVFYDMALDSNKFFCCLEMVVL